MGWRNRFNEHYFAGFWCVIRFYWARLSDIREKATKGDRVTFGYSALRFPVFYI